MSSPGVVVGDAEARAPVDLPGPVQERASAWRRALAALPQGRQLAPETWARRHRAIVVLLWVHVAGLAAFGAWRGKAPEHLAWEIGGLVALVIGTHWTRLSRRARAVVASGALVTSSALLTHLSGGYIEAHFHFFVTLGVIVLYEDWTPFLVAIAYVAIHHGVVGTLDPSSVYNHPAAIQSPWTWAGIHALFILALSTALVIYWKVTERSRALSETLLQSTTSGIIGFDQDGRVRFSNAAATSLLARAPEDIIGRRSKEFVRPWPAEVPAANEHGAHLAQLRRPDGTTLAVEWQVQAMRERGHVVGSIATMTDVTQRVRAAEQLREFNNELERRVAERTAQLQATMHDLEAFNSSVSHDLRTPLRMIRGFTDLALEDGGAPLPDETRTHLRRIQTASHRMAQTIEALLGLARVNRANVERRDVNLSELALEVLSRLQEGDPQRRVRALVQPALMVPADPALAHVVLTNLLSNAWKFTMRQTTPTIEVGALDQGDHRSIYVRDNGIGFTEEETGRLFRPFERLASGRDFEGTGIGLATAERALRRHGGTISASGVPGKGATFFFSFGADGSPVAGAEGSRATPAVANTLP